MTLEYDCTSPMTKRLLEATRCESLEDLREYLKNAQKTVAQLMNEDADDITDDFIEKRVIRPSLAAILAAHNIDPLWIIWGESATQ
jgi:hypothetical protein